jgi:transcriptional regulator with XRE-family HTH domain
VESKPSREQAIGQRLRIFRETLRISRASFALSIGIGSERLATYESGRVPLRFEVFLAIHEKYFLHPIWLATGEEPKAYAAAIADWGRIVAIALRERWRFTEAYDRALERFCKDRNRMADVLAGRIVDSISPLIDLAREHRNIRVRPDIAFRINERLRDLDTLLESFSRLPLTEMSKYRKPPQVQVPTLKQLLDQTRELVKPSGMKAVLASFLGVPQSRVSEWLGDKHEPSGGVALRLLKWVSEPVRKQTTLGSNINTTKGKTQVSKSRYEKPTQVRKKE